MKEMNDLNWKVNSINHSITLSVSSGGAMMPVTPDPLYRQTRWRHRDTPPSGRHARWRHAERHAPQTGSWKHTVASAGFGCKLSAKAFWKV